MLKFGRANIRPTILQRLGASPIKYIVDFYHWTGIKAAQVMILSLIGPFALAEDLAEKHPRVKSSITLQVVIIVVAFPFGATGVALSLGPCAVYGGAWLGAKGVKHAYKWVRNKIVRP